MEVGDQLRLTGRLQSRTYTKVSGDRSEERVAFEVSIMSLAAEVPTEKRNIRDKGKRAAACLTAAL